MVYRLAPGGVFDTTSGAFIPDNPALGVWQEYQAWLGEGNTPDPPDVSELETAKQRALRSLDNQVGAYLSALLSTDPTICWMWGALGEEALRADADPSPLAGDYPLLAALVPGSYVDLATAATAEAAGYATRRSTAGTAEAERRRVATAIGAAGDVAAVAAAIDSLSL